MEDRDFQPGNDVKHFKRETIENPFNEYLYEIIGKAHHTETGEELMIYKSIKTNEICARPLEMFMSEVDHEKYPDIRQRYRFEKLSIDEAIQYLRQYIFGVREETDD